MRNLMAIRSYYSISSKSLWMPRSNRCPLLFENLLRLFRYRLHNGMCRADCGHECCAFARGQAHFFKVTSRFPESEGWQQTLASSILGLQVAFCRWSAGDRAVAASARRCHSRTTPVAYHAHRSVVGRRNPMTSSNQQLVPGRWRAGQRSRTSCYKGESCSNSSSPSWPRSGSSSALVGTPRSRCSPCASRSPY